MKKRLALLLAIVMAVFALVSCGAPAASEAPETSGEAQESAGASGGTAIQRGRKSA